MILQGLSAEHLARLMALARHDGDDGGMLADRAPEPDPEAEAEAPYDFRLTEWRPARSRR